jgi:hypothetical protein
MLLVHEMDDRGQERVIVLPFGSVISYFTSRNDAPGLVLHILPGLCAFPEQFEAQRDAVRAAVLDETGRRLAVAPEQVLEQSLMQLKDVVDPEMSLYSAMFFRKRSKGRSGPFSR